MTQHTVACRFRLITEQRYKVKPVKMKGRKSDDLGKPRASLQNLLKLF